MSDVAAPPGGHDADRDGATGSHFRPFYRLHSSGNGLLNASFQSSLTIEHPSGEALACKE
jgi:hypothetical protein